MPAKRRISAVPLTLYTEKPFFIMGNSEPQSSIVKRASQIVLFLFGASI